MEIRDVAAEDKVRQRPYKRRNRPESTNEQQNRPVPMREKTSIQDDGTNAWLTGFSAGGGARYLQIVGRIEQAIADGALVPGDRLPPQRRIAALLGVDLTTVTRALTEARRRHLIDARGALGTFVAAPRVELAQRVDLSMNVPPPPDGVDFDDLMRRGVSQVLLRADASLLMTYQLGGGSHSDRAAGVMWLAPMLGAVEPERLMVCPGAQSALAALILSHTQPGDAIVTEPLAYPGIRLAAEQLGRHVIAVDVDADGMRPDALEEACRSQAEGRGEGRGVRLVYLNPTTQNPTTWTMPESRRHEIVATAARNDLLIVEDDPYWLLTPDAPPPLARIAPDRVCYLSTMSKCLSPGLRTAFVVLPACVAEEAVLAALRAFALMSAPLTTAVTTQWIHDGAAETLLAGIRREAAARQTIARQLLSSVGQAPPSGIHLWYTLPSYWTSQALANAARAEELRVTPSEAFEVGSQRANAIRISLGGAADRLLLASGLRRLAELLARRPDGIREIVV